MIGISQEELYTAFCSLVEVTTGRRCWTKTGIQATPKGPYATVFLANGTRSVNTVVEVLVDEGTDQAYEKPWGTTHFDCTIEFFRDGDNNSALDAANRFENGLKLDKRWYDIWLVCGLTGEIQIIDVSGIFRADTEPRSQVRFSIYSNISDPHPLPDTNLDVIETQGIDIYRDEVIPPPIATIVDKNIPPQP